MARRGWEGACGGDGSRCGVLADLGMRWGRVGHERDKSSPATARQLSNRSASSVIRSRRCVALRV